MGRSMTPQDLLRIRFVSDPQMSPDGSGWLRRHDALRGQRRILSNIWVVDASGGEPRRFTTGPKAGYHAAMVARWIAPRVSLRARAKEEGPALRHANRRRRADPPTDVKAGVCRAGWSPDGSRSPLWSRVGGWQEPENEEERQKSKPARVITTLKYKANGEGFVYDRRPHLFMVAAEGGEPRQITEGDFDDADPSWSPDGQAHRLRLRPARGPRLRQYPRRVGRVAGGGEPRRVTDTAGPSSLPDLLAGRAHHRLFRRPARQRGGTEHAPVHHQPGRWDADLSHRRARPQLRRLFTGLGPLWSPDGEWILFAVEDQGGFPALRVRVDARRPEPIVSRRAPGDGALGLAPGAQRGVHRDGPGVSRRSLCLQPRRHRGAAAHRPERLVEGRGGARGPERFRFERAGHSLDCWVMRPSGFEPGRRYPALLNIHGGPHTQYGHDFFDEFQVQAGAGYVVDLRQSSRQPGIWRRVYPRGGWRLGRWRLRRRHGRARRGDPPLRLHRRRAARGAGRQLRRVPDELDRWPHDALQGGLLRARRQQPPQHVRHQRHRTLVHGAQSGCLPWDNPGSTSSARRSATSRTSPRRS